MGRAVLRGHLDTITVSGFIEGWALNISVPLQPLLIAILDGDGTEIARGRADRFRPDLSENALSPGWNGFRVRASVSLLDYRERGLSLYECASERVLHQSKKIKLLEEHDHALTSIEEVISVDPTVLSDIEQLRGCESILGQFLHAKGVEAFIRAAYVYILGRSADREGIGLYGKLLRQAALTPFGLLRTLADSDEFRSRPRQLIVPTMAGFPFRLS